MRRVIPGLLGPLVVVGIVDRIEGPMAVVEWRRPDGLVFQDLPRTLLPDGGGEGDGLRLELREGCAGPDGFQTFLRDASACGGRMSLQIAPPWTGSVHMQDEGGEP